MSPNWWSIFVREECMFPYNPDAQLLGRFSISREMQPSRFRVKVDDIRVERNAHARKSAKLATKRIQYNAAKDVVRAIRARKEATAGARFIASKESQRSWDKARAVMLEEGKLHRLPHGVNERIDQPAAVVLKDQLQKMEAAGVSTGQYIHRDNGTGRYHLSELSKGAEGFDVIGLAQCLKGWAKMMLLAEAKQKRLRIDLDDPSTVNKLRLKCRCPQSSQVSKCTQLATFFIPCIHITHVSILVHVYYSYTQT